MLIDALNASVVELHAFPLLGEVSMLFSITPHMRVGFPHEITQLGIGKLQTLFNFNLRPIIRIAAIMQRQLAHCANPNALAIQGVAFGAHLFIIKILVIGFNPFAVLLRVSALLFFSRRPFLHAFFKLNIEDRPADRWP